MRVTSHPQYQLHQQRQARYERLRQAVSSWRTSGLPLLVDLTIAGQLRQLTWSWADAVGLAQSLTQAIEEHIRIIWQDFPFCRQCGGLCCADRSTSYNEDLFSDEISLLLLALLDQPAVVLPADSEVAPADCIYRSPAGCRWPPVGRPLPCALFYCNGAEGRGRQDTPEADQAYERLVDTLEAALIGHLVHTAVGETFYSLEDEAADGSLFWDPEEVTLVLQAAVGQVFLDAFRAQFFIPEEAAHSTNNTAHGGYVGQLAR